MSIRSFSYSAIAAALATVLSACSGPGTASPSPLPTSSPIVTVCHGWVTSKDASRRITVTTSTPSGDATTSGKNRLTVAPSTIALSASHPTVQTTIDEPHYRGTFAVEFDGCGSDFNVFLHGTHGPRITATFKTR